jgi:hypothetical protein
MGVLGFITLSISILSRSVFKMSQSTDNFAAAVAALDVSVKSLAAAVAGAAGQTAAAVDAFADQATAQVNTIKAEADAALPRG